MKKKALIVLAFVLAVAVSGTPSAHAARLFWEPKSMPPAAVGKAFAVDLFLDTEGERLNAIEGTAVLAGEATILSTDHGGSAIPLWVKPPSVGGSGVPFAGLIPGGYVGARAHLFSLVFSPRSGDILQFSVKDIRAFRDEPPGSSPALRATPFTLLVAVVGGGSAFVPPADADPPEPFVPVVARDARIFDGQWFVAFTAQDKGRGIARYYVAEEREGDAGRASWAEAASPYLLKDQQRRSYVFVKAVDGAGNERVSRIDPPQGISRTVRTFGMIIGWTLGGVLLVAGLARYLRRRSHLT